MKEKILYLILGIMIGAVVTSAIFLIFTKSNSSNMTPGGNGGNMPSGMERNGNMNEVDMENMKGGFNGEKPDGNGEEPPAKPGESSNNSESGASTTAE